MSIRKLLAVRMPATGWCQRYRDLDRDDRPKRTPFQTSVGIEIKPGFSGNFGLVAIPTGKRLVIEYISAFCRSVQGAMLYEVTTQDSAGNVAIHSLPPKVSDFSSKYSIAGQAVKLRAGPGTSVTLGVARVSGNDDDIVRFSISGYLEDEQ